MLCVVITGPSIEEARRQIVDAREYADLIELRLDRFETLETAALNSLRSCFTIPMIFTLRSRSHGGDYKQSEEKRVANMRRLMTLKPEYIDVENDVPLQFIEELSSLSPETKVILSYHNFADIPDLDRLHQEMLKIPAYFYKIAVTPQNCLDAMRLVCWTQKNDGRLIAIGMGPHGDISRILAPIIGCPITYASIDENQQTAPGQLSAKTLCERYHHHSLNPQTSIYGLIGEPVSQSISDETHNGWFAANGIDAVYIKIRVEPHELAEFLRLARQLPFCGLSVTMPLKEHILPYLNGIDTRAKAIGAANTLLFQERTIWGYNTDGIGALDAIESVCQVRKQRIVIIGAGGAAKAIAYEALQRGSAVTIVNRNAEKARQIAEQLNCIGNGLDSMADCAKAGYDILINCTPSSMPILPDEILPGTIVMDIKTLPKETVFLNHAMKKHCRIIHGYQMFVKQALGQFTIWFKSG